MLYAGNQFLHHNNSNKLSHKTIIHKSNSFVSYILTLVSIVYRTKKQQYLVSALRSTALCGE